MCIHQVLGGIVADLLKRRQTWADLTDKQRQKAIRDAADRIAHDLRGEVMLSTARNRYLMQRIERTLNQVVATQQAAAGRGRFKPAFTKLRFGENADLPEYSLATPKSREVRLSGKIDRVDMAEDGSDFVVIDYRLGRKLPAARRRLSRHLAAIARLPAGAGGERRSACRPQAHACRRVLRADAAVDGEGGPSLGGDFTGRSRRFIWPQNRAGFSTSESSAIWIRRWSTGSSEVIYATIKKDGSFGSKAESDLAAGEEFAALLDHVRRRIAEIAGPDSRWRDRHFAVHDRPEDALPRVRIPGHLPVRCDGGPLSPSAAAEPRGGAHHRAQAQGGGRRDGG